MNKINLTLKLDIYKNNELVNTFETSSVDALEQLTKLLFEHLHRKNFYNIKYSRIEKIPYKNELKALVKYQTTDNIFTYKYYFKGDFINSLRY